MWAAARQQLGSSSRRCSRASPPPGGCFHLWKVAERLHEAPQAAAVLPRASIQRITCTPHSEDPEGGGDDNLPPPQRMRSSAKCYSLSLIASCIHIWPPTSWFHTCDGAHTSVGRGRVQRHLQRSGNTRLFLACESGSILQVFTRSRASTVATFNPTYGVTETQIWWAD